MQASSPTQVCNYTRAAVFRVAVHPDIGCRGGFHIRPRTFAPPLAGPILNRPLQAARQCRGHPRGLAAARGTAGWGHPALRPPGWLRVSRLVQSTKFIRRGGIYPARGRSRHRGVPGTMQASSPTQVCNYTRAAVFRVAVHPDIGCRGGFHIRPRTFAPPQGRADMESAPTGGRAKFSAARGCWRRRGVRRDAGHPALRPPG